uniref:Protein LURP-one-related 8 n=2 Tax=Hordeum vulgare subsp. vulgare TaxID=112509 RepID=A0A8I6X1S6_HORVV
MPLPFLRPVHHGARLVYNHRLPRTLIPDQTSATTGRRSSISSPSPTVQLPPLQPPAPSTFDRYLYMAKVHPNMAPAPGAVDRAPCAPASSAAEGPTTLTVWRKSLLFDCKGFTVFDVKGNLAYRVDSYASESGDEVVLMDAAGRPAFTVRRKRFSLQGEQWLVFAGEETRRPVYAVRRSGRGKTMAHVTACAGAGAGPSYEVEGSYARRSCVVYDGERRTVAEIMPKAVVGTDVFRLVVQPGVGVSLAMAVVVALEQMFARPSLLRSWSTLTD